MFRVIICEGYLTLTLTTVSRGSLTRYWEFRLLCPSVRPERGPPTTLLPTYCEYPQIRILQHGWSGPTLIGSQSDSTYLLHNSTHEHLS